MLFARGIGNMERYFRLGMAYDLRLIQLVLIILALLSGSCFAKARACFPGGSVEYGANLKMMPGFSIRSQFNYKAGFCSNVSIDSMKNIKTFKVEHYTYKSPGAAFALALIPGFAIHGLGHYYIGDKGTGMAISFSEFLSVFFIASHMVGDDENSGKKHDRLIGLGTIMFFVPWAYDFVASPIKANIMNKQHQAAFYLAPSIRRNTACVRLVMAR
jgi:hypothetical protein